MRSEYNNSERLIQNREKARATYNRHDQSNESISQYCGAVNTTLFEIQNLENLLGFGINSVTYIGI